MKPAVAYYRVSTTQQAVEGVSLEAQHRLALGWCGFNGYEIAAEFTDAGISGKSMKNRPMLARAIDQACHDKAALVVYSLSRLARSTKDLLSIAEALQRRGADLVSLTERIDTTTASGRMVFGVLAVLAQFEREQISERTKMALAHKRAKGEKTGGSVPYGYDNKDGVLIPNLAEQANIAVMLSRRADGLSYQTIAMLFNAAGSHAKHGKPWSATQVRRALAHQQRRKEG